MFLQLFRKGCVKPLLNLQVLQEPIDDYLRGQELVAIVEVELQLQRDPKYGTDQRLFGWEQLYFQVAIHPVQRSALRVGCDR